MKDIARIMFNFDLIDPRTIHDSGIYEGYHVLTGERWVMDLREFPTHYHYVGVSAGHRTAFYMAIGSNDVMRVVDTDKEAFKPLHRIRVGYITHQTLSLLLAFHLDFFPDIDQSGVTEMIKGMTVQDVIEFYNIWETV